MKRPPSKRRTAEMRAEYDFSGVQGKYVDRYRRGTNVVLLDPELAEAFPDSKSVNDTLRALLAVATRAERRVLRSTRPALLTRLSLFVFGLLNSNGWRQMRTQALTNFFFLVVQSSPKPLTRAWKSLVRP